MTNYSVDFDLKAVEDLGRLSKTANNQFIKKVKSLRENPHIEANRLHGNLKHFYKIKLLKEGIRGVYQVDEENKRICVIIVEKREDDYVYKEAENRIG